MMAPRMSDEDLALLKETARNFGTNQATEHKSFASGLAVLINGAVAEIEASRRSLSEAVNTRPLVIHILCERHRHIPQTGTITATTVVPVCPECMREREITISPMGAGRSPE